MRAMKKALILLIVGLFIGTCYIPSLSGDDQRDQLDQSQTLRSGGWNVHEQRPRLYQSFKPTLNILTKIELQLFKTDDISGSLQISIRQNPDGNDLAPPISISCSLLPNVNQEEPEWFEFNFNDISVIPEETYYIHLKGIGNWQEGEPSPIWSTKSQNPYNRGEFGIYYVSSGWQIWQGDGCFKTFGYNEVINTPPNADANGPYYADTSENITFDGSGSNDNDGFITHYNWDFGDGNTGSGVMPVHNYTNAGEFIVTLTVQDDGGKTDIDTTTAYINNIPNADANGPYFGDREEIITLDGSNSSDSDGIIELFEWDLDNDGEYDDGTGDIITYSWSEGGVYTIGLKVTDDDGAIDTDETTVNISNQAPENPSTPSGPTEGKINEEHSFTTATNEPDGDPIWFQWSWGDGTESEWLGPYNDGELCTATHTWSTEDVYDIKVKAKDDSDLESEWSDPLPMSIPKTRIFNSFIWLLSMLSKWFPIIDTFIL